MKPLSYDQPFARLQGEVGGEIYVNMKQVVAFEQGHKAGLLRLYVGAYGSGNWLIVKCSEYVFTSLLETVNQR